ncbi:ABC transporter ATP-binding protein [Streptococcus didelphis]|uniref:ABC transporter ATP-binding protein n=1 Tax=Streptococcus didelphis TaxID=102886 RepID=A0ABY9LFG4_9STRE|nr:ABC transporter ATP-binding protein [Streptococcus didelphis]WMB27668.1 ABC transporter ATP-binding protein [Streptococcus didelphis]WMB29877.1 ABC transporter ATP-binding protein [Streptococcus didelphis]
MLNINRLEKSFGNKKVLSKIDVSFKDSGVSVIVGTNGCGKTTLMNILAHMLSFTSGEISCDGNVIGSKEYKQQVFYIPSDFYLPEYMTGKEYLDFILKHYQQSNFDLIDILLDMFDLKEMITDLLETYSFGLKKKIQIIAALASNTKYILADEVFSGLDFDTVLLLQEVFDHQKHQRSIIVISHDFNTLVRFPNHIFIMSKGRLLPYEGKVEGIYSMVKEIGETYAKLEKLRSYFGTHQAFSE